MIITSQHSNQAVAATLVSDPQLITLTPKAKMEALIWREL